MHLHLIKILRVHMDPISVSFPVDPRPDSAARWRCASFVSVTPAKKNMRSAGFFWRHQPQYFEIVTLVARRSVYFWVFWVMF